MRKYCLLFALSFLTFGLINAQLSNVPQKRTCGTVEYNAKLEKQNPAFALGRQQIEQWTQNWIAANPDAANSKAVITIPIVFHIVYKTTAENLSDARIQEQLDLLNRDFAGLNPHSMGAFAATLKVNTQIQFCMAQRKPDGTATNGIERKLTTTASFTDNDGVKKASTGGLDPWNVNQYFNVWVCNLGGGLLGYAQFPTGAGGGINATYGVVLLYDCVGVTGASAPYNGGASATHEIGHCFNLYHIWGDDGTGCNGSDQVSDTPNQAGEHYTVTPPANGVLTDACTTTSPGTMYMNFMDYTDDIRMTNFTPGQNTRIQALFATGGVLSSLKTSQGCVPPSGIALATVTTNTPATNITSSSATSGGNITAQGGAAVTARGVCWSTTSNPTTALTTITVDGSGTGTFTSNITGLNPNTTYHVRAYATNGGGTAYGTDVTFVTPAAATVPLVTTTAISAITATTATGGGNVTNANGATVTARGVCWSTSANPTVALTTKTVDGSGTGTFTSSITGLSQGVTYHVRAYATNSSGTGYGADLSFTTIQTAYTVSGDITYFNANLTPISNASIKLMNGTTQVGIANTDVNGAFTINNISSGTYTLVGTSTKPWAGVTSTDVLKMKRHISGLEIFNEPIVLSAADVNVSNSITSTDALKVLRRISGLDATFTCADWLFEFPYSGGSSVVISNANKYQSLYAICAADVNGSNNPVMRHIPLSVDYSSILKASYNEEFILPVRISTASDLNAIHLIMNYPSDIFEVVGVTMALENNDMIFNAANGQLRIVWANTESYKLNANDAIVNIKVRSINNAAAGSYSFNIKEETEFANALGHVIYNTGLSTSTIELSSASNISLNELNNSVSIYPNPSQNIIFCSFGKISAKNAKVTVYNTVGNQVIVDNKIESNGTMKLDFSGHANGFYFIQIDSQDGRLVKKVSINN